MRSLKPMTLPEIAPKTAITPLPVAYCLAERNSCAEHPMWQIAGRKKRQEAAIGRRTDRQKTGNAPAQRLGAGAELRALTRTRLPPPTNHWAQQDSNLQPRDYE